MTFKTDQKQRLDKISQQVAKVEEKNKTPDFFVDHFYDEVISLTLFMNQHCWKNQKVHAILNYHKIGFKRVRIFMHLKTLNFQNFNPLYIDRIEKDIKESEIVNKEDFEVSACV
jgi:hypothetical protein